MHIYVSKLTIIGSDNGLAPGRHQAIIWTNARILLTGPLETNFNEIVSEFHISFIHENPFQNIVWKMTAILPRPRCVKSWPVTETFDTTFNSVGVLRTSPQID